MTHNQEITPKFHPELTPPLEELEAQERHLVFSQFTY